MKELFVANGKIIEKDEADKIAKRSMEALELWAETGDLDIISDIMFVFPISLAMELS